MKEYSMWNKVSFFFILTMALMLFTIGIFTNTEVDSTEETTLYKEETQSVATEPQTEIIIETVAISKAETEYVKEPEPIRCEWGDIEISQEEFDLICTTVFCEAGNKDFQTPPMVCLTILNRFVDESGNFADTISGVIYQQDAYEVTIWNDFESRGWTEQVEEAVKYALEVNEHPADMFYFRTLHYHTFGQPYMQSDDLWFSTEGGVYD